MTTHHDGPLRSPEENLALMLNQSSNDWNAVMGVKFVSVTLDEVVAEIEVGPQHRQPYGIVHGGVYAGLVETAASVGAALNAMNRGQSAVGLENSTSFLHAVREGKLRATARPQARGRRTHVWNVDITDDSERTVATGRVRLMLLDAQTKLAGEAAGLKAAELARLIAGAHGAR